MNDSPTDQNDLLAAYLYASQQLLIVNELEERWRLAFARIGKALDINCVYVYRQRSVEDDALQLWLLYNWTADPTASPVLHDPDGQGCIYKKGTPQHHWKHIVDKQGYMVGITADLPVEERLLLEEFGIMSILVVPIHVDNEPWGAIGFDDHKHARTWTASEISILKGLAGMIGTAIANGRLYQAEKQARQHAEIIRDLSRFIGKDLNHTDIVQHILQQIKHVITFDSASIYLVSQDAHPEFIAVSGFNDERMVSREANKLLKTSRILNKMSQDLQPVISPDVRELEGWIWIPGAAEVRSFMAAPMVYHQKMIGILMLDCKRINFFTEDDLHVIETLAQHIAISLENARLFVQAQQEAAQKTAILEASTAVSSSLAFDDILTELARQLGQGVDATSAYIIQLHEKEKTAVIVAEYISEQPSAHKFGNNLHHTYRFPHDFLGDITWLHKGIPYLRHIDDPDMTEEGRQNLRKYDGKSVLSLPLIVKGRTFGYAQLWQCGHQRKFTEQQISLCVGIAQQAAIAFENSTLFTKQERQLRLSQTLQQVGGLLTSGLTLQQLYQRLFDLLAQVVEYDTVSLQLLDAGGTSAYYETGRGFADDNIAAKFINRVSRLSLKKVATPPHWMLINDTATSSAWIKAPAPLDCTRSWIGAALVVKDRIIGILNIDNHAPYAYTPETGETVAAFANQAAIAVENSRLYREIEQRINELTILHRAAQATAAIVDQDELLYTTTEMIVQAMPDNAFGIAFLSDEDPDMLIPHESAHGFSVNPHLIHIPVHASIMGRAIITGEAVLVSDTQEEPLYYNIPSALSRSEVVVPINVRGQAVGVIYTAHPEVNRFDEDDLRFLTTLAGQLSAAMERARLYKGLQQQTQMLAQEVSSRTAELQRERDRTIAILENAGESIIITDINNLITYTNPAMETLSGYTRDEMMGQHPRLWRSPNVSNTTYEKMWNALQNGRSWRGELVNVRKNGEEYDVLMHISPLTEDGEIIGYISMQTDIGRLKELDRLKSKFVSNVSHELRTPLTNIKTYLTLLERGKPEKRARYMQVMNQEVDRLARLLQDLLDLSRLEAAPLPVYLPPIDLVMVMEQYFAVFSAKAQTNQIDYTMKLPDMPLQVRITADHAGQLLTNLIGNALTYTPENGRVTVRANQERKDNADFICIRVDDNGAGIEPEDLPHVLERFYRGKGKHGSNIPGTGLGLAICNEIAERYGGHILIESELGEGTSITVWLPIAPDVNTQKIDGILP